MTQKISSFVAFMSHGSPLSPPDSCIYVSLIASGIWLCSFVPEQSLASQKSAQITRLIFLSSPLWAFLAGEAWESQESRGGEGQDDKFFGSREDEAFGSFGDSCLHGQKLRGSASSASLLSHLVNGFWGQISFPRRRIGSLPSKKVVLKFIVIF